MSSRVLFLTSPTLPRRFPPLKTLFRMSATSTVTSPKRLSTKFSDVTVSYLTTRVPKATPPILCLHGFGASSLSFKPLFETLPSHNLLAYDAPAFGYTTRPKRISRYTPTFSAEIAAHLANQPSTKSYAVIAHSMGALAASTLENVSKIVFIAPALLPRTLTPGIGRIVTAISSAFAALSAVIVTLLTPLVSAFLTLSLRNDSFWKSGLSFARHPTNPPDDSVISDYRAPMHEPRWQHGLVKFTVAALLDRARGLRESEDFVNDLKDRGCDIMIIHGADDPVVPLDNSVRLADRLDAKLVVLNQCGHVPHEEQPEIVAEYIKQFLGASYDNGS